MNSLVIFIFLVACYFLFAIYSNLANVTFILHLYLFFCIEDSTGPELLKIRLTPTGLSLWFCLHKCFRLPESPHPPQCQGKLFLWSNRVHTHPITRGKGFTKMILFLSIPSPTKPDRTPSVTRTSRPSTRPPPRRGPSRPHDVRSEPAPRVSPSIKLSNIPVLPMCKAQKLLFILCPRCAEKQQARGISTAASVPIPMKHALLMARGGARSSRCRWNKVSGCCTPSRPGTLSLPMGFSRDTSTRPSKAK